MLYLSVGNTLALRVQPWDRNDNLLTQALYKNWKLWENHSLPSFIMGGKKENLNHATSTLLPAIRIVVEHLGNYVRFVFAALNRSSEGDPELGVRELMQTMRSSFFSKETHDIKPSQ